MTSEDLFDLVQKNLEIARDEPPKEIFGADCGPGNLFRVRVLAARSSKLLIPFIYVQVALQKTDADLTSSEKPLAMAWYFVEKLYPDSFVDFARVFTQAETDPETTWKETK